MKLIRQLGAALVGVSLVGGRHGKAVAPTPAMAVPSFGHAGPGRYRVALTAWEQPDLTSRRVATLGPSRLRVLPWPGDQDARCAMRLSTLTVAPPRQPTPE